MFQGNQQILGENLCKFKKKKVFWNFNEILNQIVGMFYTNFLVSLNIKNTSPSRGKHREEMPKNS